MLWSRRQSWKLFSPGAHPAGVCTHRYKSYLCGEDHSQLHYVTHHLIVQTLHGGDLFPRWTSPLFNGTSLPPRLHPSTARACSVFCLCSRPCAQIHVICQRGHPTQTPLFQINRTSGWCLCEFSIQFLCSFVVLRFFSLNAVMTAVCSKWKKWGNNLTVVCTGRWVGLVCSEGPKNKTAGKNKWFSVKVFCQCSLLQAALVRGWGN